MVLDYRVVEIRAREPLLNFKVLHKNSIFAIDNYLSVAE